MARKTVIALIQLLLQLIEVLERAPADLLIGAAGHAGNRRELIDQHRLRVRAATGHQLRLDVLQRCLQRGRIAPCACRRPLHELFAIAERNGINIMLCLDSFNWLRKHGNEAWGDFAYNAANGGPLKEEKDQTLKNGKLDLSHIEGVAREIGAAIKQKKSPHVFVLRSTVLPGTTDTVALPILERESGKKDNVNRRFYSQLLYLLRICIPSARSYEVILLAVQFFLLVIEGPGIYTPDLLRDIEEVLQNPLPS